MILWKNFQTFKPMITMAILAAVVLLATPSTATPTSASDIAESTESQTIQLRGSGNGSSNGSSSSIRSLAALAPVTTSDRFTDDRRPNRLPVSPGIAEGIDFEELPCLVATICEQPELSILCGFTTANLGKWNNSGSENFFLGEGDGTFFAPVDGAFDVSTGFGLMSNILSIDLANATILENVLSYHAAPIDATPNATDLLMDLEDFACNGDLVMANGQTTNTICFDDLEKFQVGTGNLPMRTLPKISVAGIEACDGTVVMHLVDQLILPGLPLDDIPAKEPVAPVPGAAVCPNDRPALNGLCEDPGETCSYGYFYDGCSWGDLQCVPTTNCVCSDVDQTGVGKWTCFRNFLSTCPEEEPAMVAAIASSSEEGTPVAISKSPMDTSVSLPKGKCNPNEPLPSQPVPLECPVDRSLSAGTSCSDYPVGKTCNYGHMYLGCTWNELRCSWTESCSCTADGTWACMMAGVSRCGTFDNELGWVDRTPEGLPWGDACDPDEELPTPPPSSEVESRLSEECPINAEFGSCDGYAENLPCEYNHIYMGCTWESLSCSPVMECRCNQFGNGRWACMSMAMMPCSDKPEGHPFGQRCDPNRPLPLPPPTTTDTARVSLMAGGVP
jgi:hypothetical protein